MLFKAQCALAQSRLAHQAQSDRHTGSGVRLNGKNVPSTPCATHKSANLRRKKAGTISAGQLGDCVRTNTFIVVNSMMGYKASFRFAALATFLTREPNESLLCTGWNWLPGRHHEEVVQLGDYYYYYYKLAVSSLQIQLMPVGLSGALSNLVEFWLLRNKCSLLEPEVLFQTRPNMIHKIGAENG
ncbi:hypothetical protein T265_10921 [Opisthorchis viverrini]|uniref:Uncharacterized protein n=1 Tax=Opisthorchis viverrini TaxID=6198 RepID=A0A074ZBF0_OPIVI|nr:hypothetical protein T265_10921 [Opisthorchis viverrini]KER20550.1 hypothetical protein T265_10921 [Opisthorchis viverrini]